MIATGVAGAGATVAAAAAEPAPVVVADERSGPAPEAFRGALPGAVAANAAPTVRYSEDFEHGMGTTPVMLDQYVGRDGKRYTADPRWIDASQCNGILTSERSSDVRACPSNPQLRALANVLGRVGGVDPSNNHVVSAWTEDRPLPADAVQVEPREATPLGEAGRFVSFGVRAAAAACSGFTHPLLDFRLVDDGHERPVSDRVLDPCTDPRAQTYTVGGQTIHAGAFVSNGGLLFDGDTVRWRMRNQQTSFSGNDGAIDGVSVLDSTPRLANSFSGTPIVGGTARMTARVVNTSELGSKPGWSYSERLPDGLRIAGTPALESTCRGGTVTADGGSDLLTVRADLPFRAVDCAVSFDVTSDVAGTYTLGAGDVVAHRGVDLPVPASVTFLPEQAALAATERPVLSGGDGDAVAALGEDVAFKTTVRNDGNTPVHDLRVEGAAGPSTCAATELAPAASTVCTSASRPVDQADVDAGRIEDRVTATATARSGQQVTATADASVPTPAAAPGVAGVLTAQRDGDGDGDVPTAGDTVSLGLTLTNDGNVTLHDLAAVVDGRDGFAVSCPDAPLAPAASVACRVDGTHVLTQSEIDHGEVGFAASGSARAPDGGAVTATPTTTLPLPRVTTIVAEASADLDPSGHPAPLAGDAVTLALVVRNTGNTTVRGIAAEAEGRPDLGVRCPTGDLAPGASVRCEVDGYRLTQADVDAGRLDVAFAASGTGADDAAAHARAVTGVDVERVPVLAAHVTAHRTATSDPLARPGDHVAVAATLTNDGNVTLREPHAEVVEAADQPVDCPTEPVAPGGTVTCTVPDRVLTQSDVEDGRVPVVLTGTAVAPTGAEVAARDSVRVGLLASNALDLRTTVVQRDADGRVRPVTGPLHRGDEVAVRGVVRHTGNLTVHALRHGHGGDLTCGTRSLEPGGSTRCDGPFRSVTDADVRAGRVHFTAQVTGRVTRADGETEQVQGSADTSQTQGATQVVPLGARPGAAGAAAVAPGAAWPVVVSSPVVRDEVPVVALPATATVLAFTGSEALALGLPAALLLLSLGTLVLVVRSRTSGTRGRRD